MNRYYDILFGAEVQLLFISICRAVSVFTMAYGLSYGWASPSIMILTSEESPLPSGKITMEQSSWIAALPCAGGFFGNIIFGFITTYFGRKTPLILMAIPTVVRNFERVLLHTDSGYYFINFHFR